MSRLPLVLAFGLSTLACSGEDPESDAVRDGWLVPFTSAFPDYVHTLASLETSGQTVLAAIAP